MARATCNACPHMHCRGESIVFIGGISEKAHALEAGARDVQPVLRLYCEHPASVAAAAESGADVRHELIVESLEGVDHVCGSADSALIAEFRDTVALADIPAVPRPDWCRLDG